MRISERGSTVGPVRRYVFDLKRAGLIVLEGRVLDAKVKLSSPVIVAGTIRHWMEAYREVERRYSDVFKPARSPGRKAD